MEEFSTRHFLDVPTPPIVYSLRDNLYELL